MLIIYFSATIVGKATIFHHCVSLDSRHKSVVCLHVDFFFSGLCTHLFVYLYVSTTHLITEILYNNFSGSDGVNPSALFFKSCVGCCRFFFVSI